MYHFSQLQKKSRPSRDVRVPKSKQDLHTAHVPTGFSSQPSILFWRSAKSAVMVSNRVHERWRHSWAYGTWALCTTIVSLLFPSIIRLGLLSSDRGIGSSSERGQPILQGLALFRRRHIRLVPTLTLGQFSQVDIRLRVRQRALPFD